MMAGSGFASSRIAEQGPLAVAYYFAILFLLVLWSYYDSCKGRRKLLRRKHVLHIACLLMTLAISAYNFFVVWAD